VWRVSKIQALLSIRITRSFLLTNKSNHPNRLSLAGGRIDIIKQTGTHWAPGFSCIFNYIVAKQFISDVEKFCNESQGSFSLSSLDVESAQEAKWRIPCFDQIFTTHSQRQRTKIFPSAIEDYHELRHRVDMYPNDLEEGLQSHVCQAYLITMEYLHNRKPFISSEGYVGLAPAHPRPGDIIYIIFGAIVPFVLRNVGKGSINLLAKLMCLELWMGNSWTGIRGRRCFVCVD
jgi:hypothetical protein